MYLKGISRKDIEFTIECLKWNRETFIQKPSDECQDKKLTLLMMDNNISKLKEAIK